MKSAFALFLVAMVGCVSNDIRVFVTPNLEGCEPLGKVTATAKTETGVMNQLRAKASELGGNTVVTKPAIESGAILDVVGGEGGLFYFEHPGTVYLCP